jgi:tetratricopeptide (TPR) repeat protein
MGDGVLQVMVSSTFRDLIPEREAARDAILGLGMQPLMMETDSAAPDRGLLTSSFAMVDQADVYVLLVSNYRYGQIIADPELNPKNLSITELEFERALARGTDHCKVCAYLMADTVPPPSVDAVLAEAATKDQLKAFRARARDPSRISPDFVNPHDLKQKITQTLAKIPSGPPPGPISEPTGTAPPRPDRCVGRDPDLARIVGALTAEAHPNGVLLQGPGGIGKTTITQQAAHDPGVVARFRRRIWFATLETATDRDTFDAALLLALGLEPIRGFVAAEQLLSQAQALLVLDNLETPWESAGPAIEARLGALSAIPGVVLLASFRGQEAVGGGRWTLRHRVDPLPEPEARSLFLDIAETIPDSDPDLPLLLRDLGGVPLAICLTARRASGRSKLAALWAEWKRIGGDLAIWLGSQPGRLTSVPHSIALSLRSNRMGPEGHRLFALLGQSPAGLAEADRAALLADSAFTAAESLLRVGLAHEKDGRLDLLPPVRDHAKRQCPPGDADATAWCRHFLDRARTEGERILSDGGAKALADLTPEIANIDAALRAAPRLSLLPTAVLALHGVYLLLSASGAGSPAVLDALARACLDAEDNAGQAACLYCNGLVAFSRSDHEGARARYEQALPLYRQVGDVLGEANCVKGLGDIALRRSDHKGAQARYEPALPLYRQVGHLQGEANCIFSLGDIALRRSDNEGARARFEQALPLYRQIGDVLGEANCVQSLGNIALRRSDHEGARARYEQALPLYRQVGDVLGEANCVARLGDIALRHSDHEGARARYEQALPLFRQVGDVLGEANCALGQGRVARAKGDTEAARAHAEAALALYQRIHATQHIALTYEDLARVTEGDERAGHVEAARAAWLSMDLPDEAERLTREFG